MNEFRGPLFSFPFSPSLVDPESLMFVLLYIVLLVLMCQKINKHGMGVRSMHLIRLTPSRGISIRQFLLYSFKLISTKTLKNASLSGSLVTASISPRTKICLLDIP